MTRRRSEALRAKAKSKAKRLKSLRPERRLCASKKMRLPNGFNPAPSTGGSGTAKEDYLLFNLKADISCSTDKTPRKILIERGLHDKLYDVFVWQEVICGVVVEFP